MISKEKLQEYKKRLEEGKKILSEKITHDTEVIPDMGKSSDREGDAEEVEEFDNQLAAVLPLKERLDDVESALRKIDAGTYGICEECGKEIESEVLEVDAESRLCKECKLAK